jgi:hypothetical protein
MKKRTAIVIAGALVASMMAGVVALTIGRGIVGATAPGAVVAPKPIIKTKTDVVTVKKRRPAKAGPIQTITVVRPGSVSTASSGFSSYREDGPDSHEDEENGGDD